MEEFDKIKVLITNNEIKEACSALRRYAISGRTLNEILMQESKYHQLGMDMRNGVISNEHGSTERNKIVHHLLQIADNVKDESLGQVRGQTVDKKSASDSTGTKQDEVKEDRDTLLKEGDDRYNSAIQYIDRDKRNAHGLCVNATTYYRYITLEYPNDSYGFFRLAITLKVMYLLNYNNYRNDEKLSQIFSCIEQGKAVDKLDLYYDSFDLILIDIKEYVRKEKLIRTIYFTCIPIMSLAFIDMYFYKIIFDFKNESFSTYIFCGAVILLIYAMTLDEKKKKHIVRN